MAYSQKQKDKIIDEICNRISEGESLRSVLKDKDMPDSKTFYAWIDADSSKLQQYARATDERADLIFEEILAISDNQEGDVIKVGDTKVINHNVINRARLRVDSRKWMLGKMNPKKYSDKIQVDNTEFKEQPLFPDVPTNNSSK